MFHVMVTYELFLLVTVPLARGMERRIIWRVLGHCYFCDISCLTDIGVPHKFEIALSLKSNKNTVQMQGQKIYSGKIYVLA